MSYSTATIATPTNHNMPYEVSRSDTMEYNQISHYNHHNRKMNQANSGPSTKKGRKMGVSSSATTTTSKRQPKKKSVVKRGRWELNERITFLRGLQRYGKGKWKAIAKLIPHRTTIQVKTHAQMILKKINSGVDVFDILNQGSQQREVIEQSLMEVDAGSAGMDTDTSTGDDDADADVDDTSRSDSPSPSPSRSPSLPSSGPGSVQGSAQGTVPRPGPLRSLGSPAPQMSNPNMQQHIKSLPFDVQQVFRSNRDSIKRRREHTNVENSNTNSNNNISPIYSISSNGSLPPLPQSFEAATRIGSSPVTPPRSHTQTRRLVPISRGSASSTCSGANRVNPPVSPLRVDDYDDYADPPFELSQGRGQNVANVCRKNTNNNSYNRHPKNRYKVDQNMNININTDTINTKNVQGNNNNGQDVESAAHILLELSSCSSPKHHSIIRTSSSFSSSFQLTPRPDLACTSTESMGMDDADGDGDGNSTSSTCSSSNYYNNVVRLPPRFSSIYVDHSRSHCPV